MVWGELLIAQFGELDVIVGPYTLASTATVRITINQFLDIAVRQPKAFSTMEDGLTACWKTPLRTSRSEVPLEA